MCESFSLSLKREGKNFGRSFLGEMEEFLPIPLQTYDQFNFPCSREENSQIKPKLGVSCWGKWKTFFYPLRTTTKHHPLPSVEQRPNVSLFPPKLQPKITSFWSKQIFSFNSGINSKRWKGGNVSFKYPFHPLKDDFGVKFPINNIGFQSGKVIWIRWNASLPVILLLTEFF